MQLVLPVLFVIATANYFTPRLQESKVSCSSYMCEPSNVVIPPTNCIQVSGSNVYINPCSTLSAPYCNTTSTLCTSSPIGTTQISYPGESCGGGCFNNAQCNNNICQGKNNLDSCQSHGECSPGLMCAENKKCLAQLGIGLSGCRDYNDCVNSAACNLTYSSVNGICLEYATVATGQTVTDCVGGFSHLCETGICSLSGEVFGSLGVCIEAPTSVGRIPKNCTLDTDCQGSNGNDIFLSTCQCGYNNQGTAFCKPFIGDLPGLNFIETWASAMQKTVGKCNTVRRAAQQCLQKVGAYESTLLATWEFEYFPELQGNDACIKAVYTSPYWSRPSGSVVLIITGLYALLF